MVVYYMEDSLVEEHVVERMHAACFVHDKVSLRYVRHRRQARVGVDPMLSMVSPRLAAGMIAAWVSGMKVGKGCAAM
jgi:hypothetical protein